MAVGWSVQEGKGVKIEAQSRVEFDERKEEREIEKEQGAGGKILAHQ